MPWLVGKLPFQGRPYDAILLFALAVGILLPLPATGQQTADWAIAPGRGGIVVAVTFGRDGSVQACQLLRSNAPFQIEVSTIAHIQKHWKGTFFASATEVLPIVFDEAATVPWDGDLTPPPTFFPNDEKKYSLKLRITFGSDGWAKRVQVLQPSGIELADQQTAQWIQIHWHHDAYANQVVDAPFEFSRSLPPAPPPPPPPPAAPAPAKPVPPQEPVAIPAIRVQ